ncbi:MAG: hypothetical protein AB7I18_01235 [Candidatus Berkiella sp.]
MRVLENTELLAACGANWGFVSFAAASGFVTGLGIVAVANMSGNAAWMTVLGTTATTTLIALV